MDEKTITTWGSEFSLHIAKTVLFGFHDSEIYKKLVVIGDEIEKVRWYANSHIIEDEKSNGMNCVCLSSYFSGLVPIIRLEAAMFTLGPTNNELAGSILIRSYMEFSGRVHKGVRIWKNYENGKHTEKEFCDAACRLVFEYVAQGESRKRSIMRSGGYNVMTFIDALDDIIFDPRDVYGNISTYTHGDYWNQEVVSKFAHWHRGDREKNPLKIDHSELLERLRVMLFDDFSYILEMTAKIRMKYDDENNNIR